MALSETGRAAVKQLAARFNRPGLSDDARQAFADGLEEAITKAIEAWQQDHRALVRSIEKAITDRIDGWYREHSAPQPYPAQTEDAA